MKKNIYIFLVSQKRLKEKKEVKKERERTNIHITCLCMSCLYSTAFLFRKILLAQSNISCLPTCHHHLSVLIWMGCYCIVSRLNCTLESGRRVCGDGAYWTGGRGPSTGAYIWLRGRALGARADRAYRDLRRIGLSTELE